MYFGIVHGDVNSQTNLTNTYYKNNVTEGAISATGTPTQMTEVQMKAQEFVTTLNSNKSSINLVTYGLTDYTLSSWKLEENGYPVFE